MNVDQFKEFVSVLVSRCGPRLVDHIAVTAAKSNKTPDQITALWYDDLADISFDDAVLAFDEVRKKMPYLEQLPLEIASTAKALRFARTKTTPSPRQRRYDCPICLDGAVVHVASPGPVDRLIRSDYPDEKMYELLIFRAMCGGVVTCTCPRGQERRDQDLKANPKSRWGQIEDRYYKLQSSSDREGILAFVEHQKQLRAESVQAGLQAVADEFN